MGEIDGSVKKSKWTDKSNSITLSQLPPTPQGHVPPPYLQQQHVQPQIMNPQKAVPQVLVINQIQNTADGMRCQSCNKNASSYVLYESGCFAWFMCILLFLFGLWPCCLIPLFADSCKDPVKHCSECNMSLKVS